VMAPLPLAVVAGILTAAILFTFLLDAVKAALFEHLRMV
jgi:hypothetical protein